jgi:hypothetical protein
MGLAFGVALTCSPRPVSPAPRDRARARRPATAVSK